MRDVGTGRCSMTLEKLGVMHKDHIQGYEDNNCYATYVEILFAFRYTNLITSFFT